LKTAFSEVLNSSLSQSAADLWLTKIWPQSKSHVSCNVFIFVKSWCFEP